MKISIALLDKEPLLADGYPLVIRATHRAKMVKRVLARCLPQHYSADAQTVTHRHPDYDILAPLIMDLKLRARKIELLGETCPKAAIEALFKKEASGITLAAFGADWIAEQQTLCAAYEKKGNVRERNKIAGNIKTVQYVLDQFTAAFGAVTVKALDYDVLMRYRKARHLEGNAPATVHLHLRTLRALYNKAVLQYGLPDAKPFRGVFNGLTLRSSQSRKKHLGKKTVQQIEALQLTGLKEKARDLWLLQFYFGGCDLTDVYHLKKTDIKAGRVRFMRGKTATGTVIDLKVHPKAAALLAKYPSADEWLLPWRKDVAGYTGFRRRVQGALTDLQTEYDIAVNDGANLGIKTARHTFANIGKTLNIDEDLLRELMGHERNDVDNFYKDRYPEKKRDAALYRIIG